MRALEGALETAQKATSGIPFVRTVARTSIRTLTHWQPTQAYSGAESDDQHGASADDNFLYKVRVESGTPKLARGISDSWTALNAQTDSTVIAVATDNNDRVFVVYNRTTNLYFRESTNNGVSFGAEALIIATNAEPKGLAVDYRNTSGDLAVVWEDGGTVKRIRRTSGTFGNAASWSQSATTITGIGMTHFSDFLIVLTGTDTNDLPTVWSLMLGDGVILSSDTWGRFFIVNQAQDDEDITFQAPSVYPVETYRITYVEKFAGTPNYTRTYWTSLHPGVTYSPGDWEWLDPVPMDNTTNYGYALTQLPSSPLTVYWSRPGRVLSQELTANITLDMSGDLIEATITEQDGLRQHGEFVFDNAEGQYTGPPLPIAMFHDLDIGLGYDTLFSRPPRQSITGWEFRRLGGRSVFVLHTQGTAYWLSRSRPRTTIVHTSVAADDITRKAAARAGILLFGTGTSTRGTTFTIGWVIHAHQSSLKAIEAVAAMMPDTFLSQSTFAIAITELKVGDSVDYDFTTQGHPIYESRTRADPAASVAEILAEGALGQAFDFTEQADDKPLEDRRRDPHATGGDDADDHADARLRKALMAKDLGRLIIPPHVGLEIGDVIQYSDALVSASAIKARVTSIQTNFRRRQGKRPVYEQRVGLGGV